METIGTGALPRPKDNRDFGLATYQQPVALPETFTQDLSTIPVYMQGAYGTCGAHAGTVMDSALYNKALSPKYLWRQIKLIDGYPVEVGTDLRSIMKALTNTGDCSVLLSPNDLGTSITDYTDPSQITEEQRKDAYQQDINSYAFINSPSWDDIRQAIYQNKVVIARVGCGDGWWKDSEGISSWEEEDVLPLKLGTYVSGHFIVLYGYDANRIYFRNSWSNAWGKNGDGYFDRTYLPNVYELGTALALPHAFIFKNNLWFGQTSNDILQLQKRLGVQPQTGFFGSITLSAVRAYQKAHNIPSTGFVGILTRASLNTVV